MRTIYQPAGSAREYAYLALNLYKGCGMGCSYCWVPAATRISRKEFTIAVPRTGIIAALEKDAPKYKGQTVLLSFSSDPYQPIEAEYKITRHAIKILQKNDIAVNILTKGALLASRDFDILRPGIDKFGVTLTFTSVYQAMEYEPVASSPLIRRTMLKEAKRMGISTWVSLEPVIDTESSLRLIHLSYKYVDYYKVGKWNYDVRASHIDWRNFLSHATTILTQYKKDFYIKEDLSKHGEGGK